LARTNPWTAFYWDDWATDTAHLSHEEYSIYHRLLTHYYKSQKPLLANATVLPRLCQAFGVAQEAALTSVLAQFFELRGGKYHNKRADFEINKALTISKERVKAGERGGLAKARHLLQQKATHPQPHKSNPPTPLSGGLTPREFKKISDELRRISQAAVGVEIDDRAALQKACARQGIEFERAKHLLESGAA
jgi:uncharacterized protein YdaU (DUF1376 family)